MKNTYRETLDVISNVYKIHKEIFRAIPRIYISYLLIELISAFSPTIQAYLFAILIDTLANSVPTINNSYIYVVSSVYLLVILISQILRRIQFLQEKVTNNFLQLKYITLTLDKVNSINLAKLDDPKFNDKLSLAKEYYLSMPINFFSLSIESIRNFATLILPLIIIINYSPRLAVLILILAIPTFFIDARLNKNRFKLTEKLNSVRRAFWLITDYMEEYYLEINLYGIRKFLISYLKRLFRLERQEIFDFEKRKETILIVVNIFALLGLVFCYFLLINDTISGILTIGLFTFYVTNINTFANSTSVFFNQVARLQDTNQYMNAIHEIIESESDIKQGVKKITNRLTPPVIEFRNVSFAYPNQNFYAIKNLNLKINAGENIAILGKNGAGKSTLIKLLCRFYDVDSGEILINNINIKEYNLKSLYEIIALLTQEFSKYHFDVKTNIGIGNISDIDNTSKITKAAKLTGAHDFIKDYPNGYEQILSKRFENGVEPSHGQWQKIALSRALFKDPQVLILDEPTSSIDPKSELEIFEKVFDFASNKTVLIVSHRFATVSRADRIVVLDKGEIIEEGTHQELIFQNGVYRHTFEMQKKVFER